jgi:hypothetical protein
MLVVGQGNQSGCGVEERCQVEMIVSCKGRCTFNGAVIFTPTGFTQIGIVDSTVGHTPSIVVLHFSLTEATHRGKIKVWLLWW